VPKSQFAKRDYYDVWLPERRRAALVTQALAADASVKA
jgi:hypothetical protein